MPFRPKYGWQRFGSTTSIPPGASFTSLSNPRTISVAIEDVSRWIARYQKEWPDTFGEFSRMSAKNGNRASPSKIYKMSETMGYGMFAKNS